MIQLRRAGLVADSQDIERCRREFTTTRRVHLKSLLEPDLLTMALALIERGQWWLNVKEGFYSEDVLEIGPAVQLLHFLMNAPKFMEVIGEITGISGLTWFHGRVY